MGKTGGFLEIVLNLHLCSKFFCLWLKKKSCSHWDLHIRLHFLIYCSVCFTHSTRAQSLQVDSVQRWMEDLRHMTEVECMCVLQAKPIGVEEDSQQGELIVGSGVGAGDHVARNNLQTLLRRALVVSTELGKMFQRLEKGRWQRVHSTAVRANCHVRSLVHEYSAARSTPPEMQKVMVDFEN